MTPLPPNTLATVLPNSIVEYRTRGGLGTLLVRVTVATADPRILAQVEKLHHGLTTTPASLPLSEVLAYIRDALERTGRTPAENLLLAAFQVLASPAGNPLAETKGRAPCP